MANFTLTDFLVLAVLLFILAIQCYQLIKKAEKLEKNMKYLSSDDILKLCQYEYFIKKRYGLGDLF